MKVYVDSSVLLRVVLHEPDALREWSRIDEAVTSALTELECLRAIDRLGREEAWSESVGVRREAVFALLEAMRVIEISRLVLTRASEAFPTPIRSLDAIHLATALIYRDQALADLRLATHDVRLARAARASGLTVIGAGA